MKEVVENDYGIVDIIYIELQKDCFAEKTKKNKTKKINKNENKNNNKKQKKT